MENKRPYHHPDLKQALLEAGIALLKEDGVKGFSMRKLAGMAGVSHAAPYRHFAGKEEFLATLLLEGHRRLTADFKAVRQACGGRGMDCLLGLGWAYLDFAARHPEYLGLMFSGEGMLATLALGQKIECYQHEEHDSFGVLEEVVKQCQGTGELDPGQDSFSLSMAIWAQVHGLALIRNEQLLFGMSHQRGQDPEQVLRAVMGRYAAWYGAADRG